jgi:hypothetical protein
MNLARGFILLFVGLFSVARAQSLDAVPASRRIDWSGAGYTGALRSSYAAREARASSQAEIQRALDRFSADGRGGRVVVEGAVRLRSPLRVRGSGVELVGGGRGAELVVQSGSDLGGRAAIDASGPQFFGPRTRLARVRGAYRKGADALRVAGVAADDALRGGVVAVTMGPPSNGDWRPINQGFGPGCADRGYCFRDQHSYFHVTRASLEEGGGALRLERPLPWDIPDTHAPVEVHRWAPGLADVRVANLSIVMRSARYQGHFRERGFDAVRLRFAAHSRVENVRIDGADYGVVCTMCAKSEVSGVVLTAPASREGPRRWTGHVGIRITGADNRARDFDVRARFVHDLSVDKFSVANVFERGRGVDVNMDHHRAQNWATLWRDIDLGDGGRAFDSGGSGNRGIHAGPFTTFVDLKARRPLGGLERDFGAYLNFVNVRVEGGRQGGAMARTWLFA